MTRNRVRERREGLGLTQAGLAVAARLSRQSVNAIETGRATPAVDVALRLAGALGCAVEELFGAAPAEPLLRTERASPGSSDRLVVAEIAGRWVSHGLERDDLATSADALAGRQGAQLVRPRAECQDRVLLMGCAAALGLLAHRLNASPGPGRFVCLSRSSRASLRALAKQQVHLAGVHLIDAASGEANLPDVRRAMRGRAAAVVTLARWQVGLVVARGNPRRIRSAADLARRGLRLAVREEGAGARQLLDRALRTADLSVDMAKQVHARGHLEVARAVALGAAATGVASHDAALACGLDFVPLAEERYDLALPADALGDPRLQRLFDVLASAGFRRELTSLAYDARASGEQVT